MKDTRFIELVNQYVDRQISPAETAELEAEIQVSPRHRKIYQQYCHMHRATKLVYESFRTNADQPVVEKSKTGGSIAQFELNRQRSRWPYAVGALAAAAACFAVVVVRNGMFSHSNSAPSMAAVQTVAPAVAALPAPVVQPVAAPVAVQAIETQASEVEQQYAALLSAKRQEEMRAFALSQQMTTQPISLFADDAFDSKQALTAEAQKLFQQKRKTEKKDSTEFTAFQFQR